MRKCAGMSLERLFDLSWQAGLEQATPALDDAIARVDEQHNDH
jgi:hypothetical protein